MIVKVCHRGAVMNIDKYRMLLEAADTGSLSKAADKFGYTPSGMVHIVNSLEQEFSFPVLQRSNKGVSLTADGERIVPILREIVKWDEQLRQVSSAICGKIVGDIMVGSYFSIATNWLPEVIRRFHEDYPNVHISVIEGTHQKLDQLLHEQRADFCLFSYPPEEGCSWISLKRDPMVAMLPQDHPLAESAAFPISEFDREEIIMPAEGYDYDSMKVLSRYNITPRVSYSTGEDHAAIAMIEAGLGIGLFNRLTTERGSRGVVRLPLDPPEYAELGIAYPSVKKLSPAAKQFVKYLRDYIEG